LKGRRRRRGKEKECDKKMLPFTSSPFLHCAEAAPYILLMVLRGKK
jgi:hypothetical protein